MTLRPVHKRPRQRRSAGAGLWVLLAGWMSLGAADAGPLVRVELLPEAVVRSARVTLGDIARITSSDERSVRSLRALPLGDGPMDEASLSLGRESLVRWVAIHGEGDPGQIEWAGAPACRIHRETQRVGGEQLARCAEVRLASLFKAVQLKAEIRSLRRPADVLVPAGTLELRPRAPAAFQGSGLDPLQDAAPGSPALYAKRQSVWVDVWVDGQFIRTVIADFEVSVFAPAYVAKQDLAIGAGLDPAQVEVREVEWSGRPSMPVPAAQARSGASEDGHSSSGEGQGAPQASQPPADIRSMRARRPLAAGQVVTRADLEPLPMVARGSTVRLSEVQGGIQIEGSVVALQDGFMGQQIEVRIPAVSKAVRAVVVGPGHVEVGR